MVKGRAQVCLAPLGPAPALLRTRHHRYPAAKCLEIPQNVLATMTAANQSDVCHAFTRATPWPGYQAASWFYDLIMRRRS